MTAWKQRRGLLLRVSDVIDDVISRCARRRQGLVSDDTASNSRWQVIAPPRVGSVDVPSCCVDDTALLMPLAVLLLCWRVWVVLLWCCVTVVLLDAEYSRSDNSRRVLVVVHWWLTPFFTLSLFLLVLYTNSSSSVNTQQTVANVLKTVLHTTTNKLHLYNVYKSVTVTWHS